MKKFLLIFSLLSVASISKANNCSGGGSEICEIAPFLMIASITSAPTGTSMLISNGGFRDEVLAVQQDAINYKITGEASPLLKSAVQSVLDHGSVLSSEEIVNKIVAAKLN
jgi:hypothetical protein